jgi:uracil-DNA glycosylase
VYPPREITTPSNSIIEKRSHTKISVYNTEIAQCFPGRKENREIRNPTKIEMRNCAEMCFIERELELIRPKLVILMGKKSWSSFYEIVLEKTLRQNNLSKRIEEICQQSEIPTECIGDFEFKCLPIQHASGANPRFSTMIKNNTLVELIKEVLDA